MNLSLLDICSTGYAVSPLRTRATWYTSLCAEHSRRSVEKQQFGTALLGVWGKFVSALSSIVHCKYSVHSAENIYYHQPLWALVNVSACDGRKSKKYVSSSKHLASAALFFFFSYALRAHVCVIAIHVLVIICRAVPTVCAALITNQEYPSVACRRYSQLFIACAGRNFSSKSLRIAVAASVLTHTRKPYTLNHGQRVIIDRRTKIFPSHRTVDDGPSSTTKFKRYNFPRHSSPVQEKVSSILMVVVSRTYWRKMGGN